MGVVRYWAIWAHGFGVSISTLKCFQISLTEKYSTDILVRVEKALGISGLSKLKQIALDIFRV